MRNVDAHPRHASAWRAAQRAASEAFRAWRGWPEADSVAAAAAAAAVTYNRELTGEDERDALLSLWQLTDCYCDEAWTGRGLHVVGCRSDFRDDVAALAWRLDWSPG